MSEKKSLPAIVMDHEDAARHEVDGQPPMTGPDTFAAHALHQIHRTNIKMLRVLEEHRDLLRDFRDEFILFRKLRENGH